MNLAQFPIEFLINLRPVQMVLRRPPAAADPSVAAVVVPTCDSAQVPVRLAAGSDPRLYDDGVQTFRLQPIPFSGPLTPAPELDRMIPIKQFLFLPIILFLMS